MKLRAQPINCTLKGDATKASSTDAMIALLAKEFGALEVEVADPIRIAALNIAPGVSSDEGDGDEWPGVRTKILAADILIFGTPIWMGQPSSVAKRVLERMDAFLGETDKQGRMPSYSKVAVVAIVGNEDGRTTASPRSPRA
uniref:Flavodoxin family protein n=1 Tax=Phenylobacterium glaciei TaxID=2803784 RepID=A0A974P349_9CAUL|nr:flavodoxin family protein [Phenylobacterium glaciei]